MHLPDRHDIFICYSRQDMAFAARVRDQLRLAGRSCWMDMSNIRHGEEWWPSILAAIERSTCFVCLVSRAFQTSRFCDAEAAHAKLMKKRIIQVLSEDVDSIPQTVEHINAIPWLPGDTPEQLARLILTAIERDFDYDRQRRELLAKALEWSHAGRPNSLLLRGGVLSEARALLARCANDGLAVDQQKQFLAASISLKWRTRGFGIAMVAVVLLLGSAAMVSDAISRSREQAATALASSDPVGALSQGIAAMEAANTIQAGAALRSALVALPPIRVFHAGRAWTSALPLADGRIAVIGDDGVFRFCSLDKPGCSATAGGGEAMTSVVADPRGKWFVAGSRKRVWYFDQAGLREIYRQAGAADGEVDTIVASGDGAVIAIARSGAPAILLGRGGQAPVVLGLANARPIAVSMDGRRIALDVTRELRYLEVWGVDTALRLTRRESRALRSDAGMPAQFSPDGRVLAFTGDYESASLWHFETATPDQGVSADIRTRPHQSGPHPGVSADIRTRAHQPAPRAQPSSCPNVGTDPRIVVLPHDQSREEAPWFVRALAFSPDGQRLATAGDDRTARIWEVADGRLQAILRGHTGAIGSVAFSPDGLLVATAGDDHAARLWNAADGRPVATMRGQAQQIRHARFAPDGMTLLTDASDGTARAYPAGFGYPFVSLSNHRTVVRSVEFSPDGTRLVIAGMDGAARLWTLGSPESMVLQHSAASSSGNWLRHAHFSPDGARIVTSGNDCTFRVWRNGRIEADLPDQGGAACAGGHARFIDSTTLWTGSRAGIIRWKLAAGAWSKAGVVYSKAVDDFALSPDGRWLATRGNAGVTLVDLNGKRADWKVDGPGTVFDMAFSPDSTRLVVAGNSPIVDVWNIEARERSAFLIGHRDVVYQAAFNGDGSLLATSSADGSALLWDWASARPLAELTGQAGFANSVAFSQAGDRVAVAGTDPLVRIYQCPVCGGPGRMLATARRQLAAIRAASPQEHPP